MVALFALLTASRIIVTEVMANPAGGTGAHGPEDRNEFIEFYNTSQHAVDLHDWTIDDGDSKDRLVVWEDSAILGCSPNVIIGNTWLRPRGYAVVLDSEYADPAAVGGFCQPYRFGDSCLILTVRNTTLGNGLAGSDPLAIASPYGDTSTFGTPSDTADMFPYDAGDGHSWERVFADRPDGVNNWAVCTDSASCTPGLQNSIAGYLDLAVVDISLIDTALPVSGQGVNCRAIVRNSGFRPSGEWTLDAFLDVNGNRRRDPNEAVAGWRGWPLESGTDTTFDFRFSCPNRATDLWIELDCDGDRDTANNRSRITISPRGARRLLELELSRFSPNDDGFEDTLAILYRLPEPGGRLSIAIFDLGGRRVRDLLQDRHATNLSGVVGWNGRRSDGASAAAGVYAVWLEYRSGGDVAIEKLPVVLLR